jgi:hypothetical protein
MRGLALIASLLGAGLLNTGMSAEEVAKRSLRVPFMRSGGLGTRAPRARKLRGRKPQRRFGAPVSRNEAHAGAVWLTYSQHDTLVRMFGAKLTRTIERTIRHKGLTFTQALAYDPFQA